MLCTYFWSILCILKFPPESSTSIYGLFKEMLFLISKFWGDFPHIFLLLTSSLISLWLEDILCMILILLNLLGFVLWPRIYTQPSICLGSTSGNSTNHGSKIFEKRKNSQKFQTPKLEFATWADNYLQSIYIVLGIISNL